MLSTIVDGKVLDWHYKQHKHPDLRNQYMFYIGDIYVGEIHRMSVMNQATWCACAGSIPHIICPVYGFRTRYDASVMLLKLEGYNA